MEFGVFVESPQIIIKFIMPMSKINYEIIAKLMQGFSGVFFYNEAFSPFNELLN